MIRRAISVFLLLIILSGSAVPFVSAATNQTDREAQCSADAQTFSTGLGGFVVDNLLWGAAFMGLDAITSLLEELTVFGWKIGGVIEPIEQAIGFIRNIWMEAVIWGVIASFFNWFAGSLIEAGIELNYALTTENPLISYGGGLILQLTNLGLVISIIFVGIATILRQDKFSVDKLLFKLIVGIILVNLTIPIALFLTNAGTRITKVMYESSAPCPINITHQFTAWGLKDRFINLLRTPQPPTTVEELPSPNQAFDHILQGEELSDAERRRLSRQRERLDRQASAFTGMLGGLTADILSLVAGSIMSFVAALTFLALAIFLIIRYVVLMLLIIFSPLIWLGFIFSDLKLGGFGNIWSGWWSQFLKWTFFGPVIILFISFTSGYLYHITRAGGVDRASGFVAIAELIAVIIISAAGLYAAFKFSGVAGGLVMQAASGGLGFIANKAQGLAKKVQIGADMRAKELKDTNPKKAKAFALLSRASQTTGVGFGLSKSSSLLGQVGIKPTIKAPDEKEIRKNILEKKAKELEFGKPNLGTGFSVGVGWQPTIAGVPMTDKKWEGLKTGYVKDPKQALSFSEDDAKSLSEDGKKAFVSAIRNLQKISSSLNYKELSSLRKHEKTFAPELSKIIMKDVQVPSASISGVTMSADELNKAKNMLELPAESVSEIVRSETSDTIEKGIKTILALENELKASPFSFNKEELSKLQNLRRSFDEKITDYILDSLDPLANPESILDLSNKNLSQISKSGTTMDKNKLEESLLQLIKHPTNPEQEADWQRIDAKINVCKSKNEWL